MRVTGVNTPRPNIAIFGVIPVTECTVIRYAESTVGKYDGQLLT